MRSIKNRLLAILMTLVMVVGLLPAGALASSAASVKLDDVRKYLNIESERFDKAWDQNKALEIFITDTQGNQLAHGKTDVYVDAFEDYAGISKYKISVDASLVDADAYEVVSSTYDFSGGTAYITYNTLSAEVHENNKVWNIVLEKRTNDVTFLNDGSTFDTQTIPYGDTATEPTPTPEKEGFEFLGWFEEGSEDAFNFSTPITAPLTLTAKWEAPVQYPYTMSLTYQYSNNGKDTAVSTDVLSKTAEGLALTGVTYTVTDGRIDLHITKSALDTSSDFDYGVFVFEMLSDGSTLTNKGQDNNTVTSFDPNGEAQKAPKLLYKKASVEPTGMDAWYFIRTDGLVPMENGSTGYPSNQYLPDHDTKGGLPGTVLKANSWSENYGPIVGDTINGIALSEAFAKVQEALADKPNQAAIDTALAGLEGYDPQTQGVIWYVVKTASHATNSCPGYHVDGVLYTKGNDPAQVRVLNYLSNIPGDEKELLAYSVHGLGTSATVSSLLPSREGYDFIGWNTERDGSGTEYKSGETLAMNEDHTLYAQWKPKGDPQPPEKPTTSIEIYHFYVGGTTEDDQVFDAAKSNTVSRDYKGVTTDYVNSLNTLDFYKDVLATRNVEYRNYTLYAYDDNGAGGDKAIVWDGSAPLDLTHVKTLRIHLNYYQTRYSVVYNTNGGTGTAVTKYYNTAAGYTVLDNTGEGNPNFTRDGYTFSGWAKGAPDGEKVSAGATGAALKKSESVTYYAHWTKNEGPTTYGVTYEYTGSTPSGMTPPVDAVKYKAGDTVNLATTPVAPANYTFNGWTLSGGLTATEGKFTMPDHAVTITGNWTYTAPSGGGDPTPPSRYTVTVNYLNEETGASIAEPFKTALITSGSRYDVTTEATKEISGYAFSSTDVETSGTLHRNLTINAYYTAVEDIPEEDTPLAPGPDTGDNGGTDIPDEETPLAPLPDTDTGNGGATGDDTVIEEENPPLGNLPQTGTTAQSVNPALTLGALALALSMAAAGLTISLTRKKEEEN